MRTKSTVVTGEAAVCATLCWLVERSVWFQVTPLPDGEYEITVKEEFFIPLMTRLDQP